MRIVIDLQGAQTASRLRGIGRYTLSLTRAILKNKGNHDIWLVLNSAFPHSIVDIRHEFASLIPPTQIQVFDAPLHIEACHEKHQWRTQAAEKIREKFIQCLQPDFVLIVSLFEGYVDNAVTSIGSFYSNIHTAVVLHDLIPLLNPKVYLPKLIQKQYYDRKIDSLKKANLLLANSDHSRQCAIDLLDYPTDRIVTISAATEDNFAPKKYPQDEINTFFQRHGITRKIVLYAPGGFDVRKNFENLITAYSLLSPELRQTHQLVITSKIYRGQQKHLDTLRSQAKLAADEVITTNYLSNDELILLYNQTTLFVFPSLNEGFGFPILEAMACGAAAIGSNCTSIPAVIDNQNALFDPTSPQSIADKMSQVLQDEKLRKQLQAHGLAQAKKFSWDITAQLAISAMEKYAASTAVAKTPATRKKPRLAFVSPLPPEQTGIADYSEELLSALIQHFDIELITDQQKVSLPAELSGLPRRTVSEFTQNSARFDRILYQFGNSPFHTHMLHLLKTHPGVVVLHDFFLSSLLAYEEQSGRHPAIWTQALFNSHGYHAVQSRFDAEGIDQAKTTYPCNLDVLQNAQGIIVHSNYSQQLARQWYGNGISDNWHVIPLLRAPIQSINRKAARLALGLSENVFLVCSFGFLDHTKLNHQLLQAWIASQLATHRECELVFVGVNHGGDYGAELLKLINQSGYQDRIKITGRVDKAVYNHYLEAADMAVQLRTLSRGETSAAILDCMNYGLATITNANGSVAELPADTSLMLADEFTTPDLVTALETLWKNPQKRQELAKNAREYIATTCSPTQCAAQYAKAIESAYRIPTSNPADLIQAIAETKNGKPKGQDIASIAQAIANSFAPFTKQILVDITSIVQTDLKTGIERVIRAQLLALIKNPPAGFRVEAVYLKREHNAWHYCYARKYICATLGMPVFLADSPVEVHDGDLFYSPDFSPHKIIPAAQEELFLRWRASGVSINTLVYDILPILKPEFFPEGAHVTHSEWLKTVAGFSDRIIGISRAVTNEVQQWLKENKPSHLQPLTFHSLTLGADITASAPSYGLPPAASHLLAQLKQTTSFLMVGTVEPRKGHLQTLAAFDILWKEGRQVMLIIVGKEGWNGLPDSSRRTLPEIVKRIQNHPELGKKLFWLQDVSDEYLQALYQSCSCLIMASEGEGFGLPLVEAMYYKLPIIARNIPIFHEIAEQNAYYFSGLHGYELADAIKKWLDMYRNNAIPTRSIPWKTWQKNAEELLAILFGNTLERTS
jgi:glycosyltransferase involved in cell wall biosynthesis